ncbi:hypothetical protein [Actinophytocola sp.]|uniref:hypothetical protein n=1 Tax=Actinophytocola sp. TaxID=1872138 RepID=UPI002D80F9BF|nr:hypothetical protein [Actinophytocola sp.]HET9142513.1 hypothetical protein [Actinophytocola sp.]
MRQRPATRAPRPTRGGRARVAGSGVAVLARRGDQPRATRTGATVFPLDRHAAGRVSVVGLEVAVTGRLAELLPTPPTAIVVVPFDADFAGVVEQVRDVTCGLLDLDGRTDPQLTVGVACPWPVAPRTAADLCLYNVHRDALPEALVESVAAAQRDNLFTANGNCVLLVQRFLPPRASAVVYASPDRRTPVRISARWGLTEGSLDADTADLFEVPSDGRGMTETLAWKPTANVTAHGGTHTVDLAARCRNRRSLSRSAVLRLAARARSAAIAVDRALSLDVAMFDEIPVVLRCRPCAAEGF